MNVMTEYIVTATNAYPALTARVKELEEENERLRSDLGKSLVALMQENRTQAEDVIDAYRITFDDGPPHAIDWAAALNKEPTT